MASTITTVKDLIHQSYSFSGCLGEGEILEGDRLQMGIYFLNQLITSANMQVFLPFAQVCKDLEPGFQVYLLTEDPAMASNQNEIPEEVRPWGAAKIIQAPKPKIVNSVGYKVGLQYTELTPVGTTGMMKYIMPVKAAPSYYSYEEYPNYTMLLLDRPSAFPIRMVYSRNLEMVDINDRLGVPMQYVEYLMTGLAYRLAVKYQQPTESIASLKLLHDESTHNIKELVKNDHAVTWADTADPNGFGGYGFVFSPPNWA